ELSWDVARSPSLTDEQRSRIMEKLANRIDCEGVLRLTDAGSRSQHRNRARVTDRFQELVARALRVPKPRKRTRPPKASKEERLRDKKRRADLKKLRAPVDPD